MPKTKDCSIRKATLDDVFKLTVLAKEAYDDVINKEVYSFSSEKVENLFYNAIEKDNFLVLALCYKNEIVGYFLAIATDCFFAIELQATCLSWFVRPEHQDWGREQKVVTINISNLKVGTSEKGFKKLGFTLVEEAYVKRMK
jgi:hypothetical protein